MDIVDHLTMLTHVCDWRAGDVIRQAAEEITSLRQQLDEAKVDSERYRWLREHKEVSLIIAFFGNHSVNKTIELAEAEIDKAMKQDTEGEG